MFIKKHIPNFITCLNLIAGCIGAALAFDGDLKSASWLIFLACLFDFLDGFAARILRVSSPIGKELDSLADMVTFGFLPSVIIFKLIRYTPHPDSYYLSFIAFTIAVFSALRLAKFNVDERQSTSFIGLPTPANAILIASIPLIRSEFMIPLLLSPFNLAILALVMSFLLVSPIELFSLKFKDFSWKNNQIKYIFLVIVISLITLLNYAAIPVIIILYVILSMVEKLLKK